MNDFQYKTGPKWEMTWIDRLTMILLLFYDNESLKFVKKIQSQITNVRSIKLSEMLEAASAQMEIQLKDLVDQRLTIREQEKKLEEKYKEGSNHVGSIWGC